MSEKKINYKVVLSVFGYSLVRTESCSHLFIVDWGMTSVRYTVNSKLKIVKDGCELMLCENGELIKR